MKIVTFNLRVRWDNDGINSFIHRVGLIYEKISQEQPDVIGFQEMNPKHLEVLEKLMPEYLFVSQGAREDRGGEMLCTAIRRDTCALCGMEVFWLSPQIHVPGSRFEGQSKHPRICLMTRVRHQDSGTMIRVYNTHLDHIGSQVAAMGMQCVLDKIRRDSCREDAEIVLLGDFNETPEGEALALCRDSIQPVLVEASETVCHTYHGFGKRDPFIKIDYIFVSAGVAECVKEVRIWEDQKNGIYLSDHYPICAEIDFGQLV